MPLILTIFCEIGYDRKYDKDVYHKESEVEKS